jgi:prefoldin subunit 5
LDTLLQSDERSCDTKRPGGGGAVITNAAEYEKAHSDLRILEQRIADLERDHPVGEKGFTKAGVRKMIAKINEELAVFESREEARLATPR